MKSDAERDQLNLGGLLRSVSRSITVSVALLLTFCGIGVAASYLLTPKYDVEVLLAPARQADQGGGLGDLLSGIGGVAGLAGLAMGGERDSAEAIAMLSSRKLITEFIGKNELMVELFSDRWDSQESEWKSHLLFDTPTIYDGIKEFEDEIQSVEVDQRTGLITLTIRWKDAEQAAEWASGLVALLNENTRSQAIAESSKSLEFLDRELRTTSVLGVKQAIFSLIEQEIGRIMLANVNEEYALRVIDPPVVPDDDEYSWPSRVLFGILGGFLGLFAVLLLAYKRMDEPLVIAG